MRILLGIARLLLVVVVCAVVVSQLTKLAEALLALVPGVYGYLLLAASWLLVWYLVKAMQAWNWREPMSSTTLKNLGLFIIVSTIMLILLWNDPIDAQAKVRFAVILLFIALFPLGTLLGWDDGTPLLSAMRQGSLARLQRLITRTPAQVNTSSREGDTPLSMAIAYRDIEVIRILLANGADPNLPARSGITPLYQAVLFNRAEIVRLLLESGADPESAFPQLGITALHLAATLGRASLVQLLLDHGADANALTSHEATSLHLAAARGSAAVVELLLAAGAKPDLRNEHGETPLAVAMSPVHGFRGWLINPGRARVANLLSQHGAM